MSTRLIRPNSLNPLLTCLLLNSAILAVLFLPVCVHAKAPDTAAVLSLPETIQFNRDIRPILSNTCFECHGPDEKQREGELRLDSQEGAFAKRDGYELILPGNPEKSELYRRLITDDEEERMPYHESGRSLAPRQIALVKRWIQQGAKWQNHWSLIPPVRPPVPDVAVKGELADLDRFIVHRLQQDGLELAPEADRRTLIRRLSFDLTGLPPTPEQVEAFLADRSAQAYPNLVDRLLESSHYGERMAIFWLDLVRYADSIGYHSDTPRDVWMYRDYVIRSFNQNKPFDQFAIEQLAGDLLPDTTNEQKIASGYNRLLQTTEEGGAQAKEYMAKYAADRVRNVSSVWLGATMGCAECHDHKFDPYTTRDFYSLAAFFADIKERAVGKREHTALATPEHQAQLDELQRQIAAAELDLKIQPDRLTESQTSWEAQLRKQLETDAPVDVAWIDDGQVAGGKREGAWNYIGSDKGPVHSGSQSRRQSDDGLVQHFVSGAKDTIKLDAASTFFAYVWLNPQNPPQQIMLQFNDGSWEHRAWWGEDRIPYGGVGTDAANHRKLGPLPEPGKWVRLEVRPPQVGLKPGSVISGMAFTQWGGLAHWDQAGTNRSGIDLPQSLVEVLGKPLAERTQQQAEALASHYRTIAPQLKAARDKVAELKRRKDELSKQSQQTLITVAQNPRTMRILPRGNWLDDSGPTVEPDTPQFMAPLGFDDRRANRLDLARWLVRNDNPMAARAQVNRLWKLFFGYGIARTLDDMGSRGEWPTHPELLDWLTVDFIESGWDVKRTVKQLVMSRTYRQTSAATAQLRARDPYNRLYARQTRFRLDAEMVRDNALQISGLLVKQIGGPSVKPYQPAGYWAHLNFPTRRWQKDAGEKIYRRGLYTHWQRTFLHPSLLAFDAPTREECTAERPRSNTPLQALVLLNDPTYVEAARAFAERILEQSSGEDQARLKWAFRQALQRDPRDAEGKLLAELWQNHQQQYQADDQAAQQLLGVGDRPVPSDVDRAELAAWTSVARVILNLHETITRY